jgi:hypothetical protein
MIAAAVLVTAIGGAAQAAETLPFIHDDYSKAVARASKEHRPIFVEAWAPW